MQLIYVSFFFQRAILWRIGRKNTEESPRLNLQKQLDSHQVQRNQANKESVPHSHAAFYLPSIFCTFHQEKIKNYALFYKSYFFKKRHFLKYGIKKFHLVTCYIQILGHALPLKIYLNYFFIFSYNSRISCPTQQVELAALIFNPKLLQSIIFCVLLSQFQLRC